MKLIFGHGYLGSRVTRLWRAAGQDVTIVTREPTKAARLKAEGYHTVTADICNPDAFFAAQLPAADTVLFAVGFERRSSARSILDVYRGGLANVLAALAADPSRPVPLVVYVSSTGVYGDADGDWVDEQTPTLPLREGGRACLAAEQLLAAHPLGRRAVILRLAGIYGPDRVPRSETLLRGESIDAPADGYLNLIHVDDAARAVLAVEAAAKSGRIAAPRTYCVSDGRPGLRRDYYAELARLLGAPPPRFVEPAADTPAAQRAAADKRISNARLIQEVGFVPAYPSFHEGLAAIVAEPVPAADLPKPRK